MYSAHTNLLECRYVLLEWDVGHPDKIRMKEFKINTWIKFLLMYMYILPYNEICTLHTNKLISNVTMS